MIEFVCTMTRKHDCTVHKERKTRYVIRIIIGNVRKENVGICSCESGCLRFVCGFFRFLPIDNTKCNGEDWQRRKQDSNYLRRRVSLCVRWIVSAIWRAVCVQNIKNKREERRQKKRGNWMTSYTMWKIPWAEKTSLKTSSNKPLRRTGSRLKPAPLLFFVSSRMGSLAFFRWLWPFFFTVKLHCPVGMQLSYPSFFILSSILFFYFWSFASDFSIPTWPLRAVWRGSRCWISYRSLIHTHQTRKKI